MRHSGESILQGGRMRTCTTGVAWTCLCGRRNILSPSSVTDGVYLRVCTASKPRRTTSSSSPPSETPIFHIKHCVSLGKKSVETQHWTKHMIAFLNLHIFPNDNRCWLILILASLELSQSLCRLSFNFQ
jgi:hypothetical protein